VLSNQRKLKLALLIPAHNEEVVIQATIRRAIKTGQTKRDIYVVSDGSSDKTVKLAKELLGPDHVLAVKHSGKAGAIKKALKRFEICERYTWMHVADADSLFGANYFKVFRRGLDAKHYVAVTGYVQSQPGDWVSKFRVYEYTLAFTLIRRLQALFGVITVMPGPTSCLRTDIIKHLDFTAGSLTEDFDITVQIHRKKLGRIRYVAKAKTYTQDPQNLHDYIEQVSRWYRGFFQGVRAHRLGLRPRRLDAYVIFLIGQTVLYTLELVVWLPLLVILTHRGYDVSIFFVSELVVYFALAAICAQIARRLDILSAFPLFYFLRLLNLYIFIKAFVEVILLKRFSEGLVGWSTTNRRYLMTAELAK